ncbi:AMP-binding protein [Amycolatopsis sp. NPDC059657]|uniref:AMP-binding protein n=1 Tax=Amycolatopsis sp. NPDC059657 TaxID=3346899 RepID=UPI00366FCEA9
MSIHEDLLPRALFVENTASSAVGDLLFRAAGQHQDSGLLYATTGQFVRYPELRDEALRVLGGLREIGVRPGQVVVLLPEQGEDFIPALWACFLGGFIACAPAPITDSLNERVARLKQLDELLDRPFFVTDDLALTSRAAESGLLVAGIEQARLLGATITPHEVRPYRPDPSEVALTMLTSGSTGVAKAVQLTHANLLAALAAKIDALTLTAEDVMLNWVSFDHVAATIETHILPLAAGAVQVHVPPSHVLADPLEFPRLIGRHGVTITFTPNFLLGLVNAELDRLTEPLDADLSAVRYVISGGEANPVSTGVGFLDRLAPYGLHSRALWPAFGMTETCAGSLYNQEFPDADAGAGTGDPHRRRGRHGRR